MDYKEKYEKAVQAAMLAKQDTESAVIVQTLEEIFPELRGSEDERIRKELIEFVKSRGGFKQEYIAWLEKQGSITKLSDEEQNKFAKGVLTSCALSFIDYLDAHKYEDKMCVSNGECEDIENAFHNAMWDRLHRYYCKYIEKQGEQKPAWSEDDEENLNWFEKFFRAESVIAGGRNILQDKYLWLKSLKERYTWKPSDEQMMALNYVVNLMASSERPTENDLYYNILKSLREQLKKLREE